MYARRLASWSQAPGLPIDFPLRIRIRGLDAADSAVDHEGTLYRARAWSAYAGPGRVETTRRRWPGFNVLDVPHRLAFNAPQELAEFAGNADEWSTAAHRMGQLRNAWPNILRLPPGEFAKVMALADPDWSTVLATLSWADKNDTAGYLARQLPIPGADTKWVQRHWPLIDKLSALGARSNSATLSPLNTIEKMTLTRVLDESLRNQIGGLGLFAAPPTELARLPLTPKVVIVCENLQNAHAFIDRPGTVVLAGKGFDIPAYAKIPWLHTARILYWGDIDTHGFAILNRFRSHLSAESILMDEGTLLRNRASWVTEDTPTSAVLPNLTDAEQRVYRGLIADVYGTKVRFEQERVPWQEVSLALANAELA